MAPAAEAPGENCVERSRSVDGGEPTSADDVPGVSRRSFTGVSYLGVDSVDDLHKRGRGLDRDLAGPGCEEVVTGVGDGASRSSISSHICRVDLFERQPVEDREVPEPGQNGDAVHTTARDDTVPIVEQEHNDGAPTQRVLLFADGDFPAFAQQCVGREKFLIWRMARVALHT